MSEHDAAPPPRFPPAVAALLEGSGGAGESTLVWAFAPGRTTWRLRRPGGEVWYLKVAPAGAAPSLADEAVRMRWLGPRLVVPRVLGQGQDGGQEWLLTAAVDGTSAVDPALRADPERLVPLLAEGLRRFHRLPWRECPFDSRLDRVLETVREHLRDGRGDPECVLQRHGGRTAAEALRYLETVRPPAEDLVVCHGDYCVPNVLVRGWRIAGFVDLGAVGVADRWRDLGIALWSVTRNLGPGWEDRFLEAYGVPRDPQRLAYYVLLYDLLP